MPVTESCDLADQVKLIQLSDSHLFADPSQRLLGVDTAASLRAVVDLATQEQGVAAVLATGDISQDGSISSYKNFADIVQHLNAPLYWVPGNHDVPRYFHTAVTDFPLPVRSVLEFDFWRIILLDSVVCGAEHGYLDETEMAYLAQQVKDDGRHHLLVMHHHPLASRCAWLDTMQLQNSDVFQEFIHHRRTIRGVVYGHIHQASGHEIDGIKYLSTPSTCFQFRPQTNEFSLDAEFPGYRRLILSPDGGIGTEIIRLPAFDMPPEAEAGGY